MKGSVEQTWRVAAPESGASDRLLYLRHLFAYEHAISQCSTRGVALDLACGTGYGVSLLSTCFDEVIALDLASSSLASLGPSQSARRVQADACHIPLRDSSVDLVVAFQLLEHVDIASGVAILTEIRRVLKPDGVGFCTTPNANLRLLPGQTPWNPFHVLEYRPGSIRSLCRRAGLPPTAIRGIVGVRGAQQVEETRVSGTWLVTRPTSLRMRVAQAVYKARQRFRPPRTETPPALRADARSRDYYQVSNRISRCIDFLVEVSSAVASRLPRHAGAKETL
jgi:SAM-dependent methyltransferase